jgi:hypothetical protein
MVDLHPLRTLTVVGVATTLVVTLGACGSGRSHAQAQTDAATACQQMESLESEIAGKEGPGRAQAALVLSHSQRLINEAAALDGRWKRLQVDVTVIHNDLDKGLVVGFSSAVQDSAEICAPAIENGLGTTVPTTG